MANAKIKLPDGTEVTISGSAEEIAKVVSLYSGNSTPRARQQHQVDRHPADVKAPEAKNRNAAEIDLAEIVNVIRDCDEAEVIETKILDLPDALNRILMCLYINEVHFGSKPGMTTGDISKVLTQLGVPISTGNVSNAISRKAGSYVMTDGVRTKGAVIRYSLNRRGTKYFQEVLESSIETLSAMAKQVRVKSTRSKSSSAGKTPKSKTSGAGRQPYKPKYNSSLDLLGIEEFILNLNLENNTEYVVAFYKFLSEHVKHHPIDGDDIYTCFDHLKAKIKLPGSFMDTLRNAQNRSRVISYERGFTSVVLTPKGENLFNHEISNRRND